MEQIINQTCHLHFLIVLYSFKPANDKKLTIKNVFSNIMKHQILANNTYENILFTIRALMMFTKLLKKEKF